MKGFELKQTFTGIVFFTAEKQRWRSEKTCNFNALN